MFIAAKIVRVDPAGRLPVIAHLRVLQAIGWRWLCDCTTNRVDVPETALEFLARASSVANRHRSASGSTLESPKAGAIPFAHRCKKVTLKSFLYVPTEQAPIPPPS
jgi:hypothetical protein